MLFLSCLTSKRTNKVAELYKKWVQFRGALLFLKDWMRFLKERNKQIMHDRAAKFFLKTCICIVCSWLHMERFEDYFGGSGGSILFRNVPRMNSAQDPNLKWTPNNPPKNIPGSGKNHQITVQKLGLTVPAEIKYHVPLFLHPMVGPPHWGRLWPP